MYGIPVYRTTRLIGLMRTRTRLGQHFLVDRRVARRIVDAVSPRKDDVVFEIGPGKGALTRLLVLLAGYVVGVEVDARLAGELVERANAENLTVLRADALQLDWSAALESAERSWRTIGGEAVAVPRFRVVANLPYYISTPIVAKLMGVGARLFDLTLMLQNEVADRIASGPGNSDYGYLSILVQFHCRVTKLFEVEPSAFKPAPRVKSAVIRLEPRRKPPVEVAAERFFSVVQAAFAQRRKTIANNLKAARPRLGFSRSVDSALEAAKVISSRRAQTLSLEEFASVVRALDEDG